MLLKFPLAEFVSSAPPQPLSQLASSSLMPAPKLFQGSSAAASPTAPAPGEGLLYIYDSASGVLDHMKDGIQWETKKMNIKVRRRRVCLPMLLA
jgi:hypothetical protein